MDSVTFESKDDLLRRSGQIDPNVARYIAEIDLYEDAYGDWYKNCSDIKNAYTDDKKGRKKGRYNVLWSNLENLKPSVFYNTPKIEAERRYKDKDPIAREAATYSERSTQFYFDKQETYRNSVLARDEYLLYGRGVLWVRYAPHFEKFETKIMAIPTPEGGFVNEDGEPIDPNLVEQDQTGAFYYHDVSEDLVNEEVSIDFIHRDNFGHNVCRNQNEIKLGWKKLYLTREELIERFGEEIGKKVPLNYTPKSVRDKEDDIKSIFKKAEIFEIWDKDTKTVSWLCRDYKDRLLKSQDDPLKLEGFFPFRIIYGTVDTDSLIPRPDYLMYKAIGNELAKVNYRISALTDAVKVKGLYPAMMKQVAELATSGPELSLIPVENWAQHLQGGGIKGMVDWMPINEIAQVMRYLYDAKDRLKQDLYEISGQSDILRGQTDPRETATAQRGKMQFASLRLNSKQKAFAEFLRDTAQVVAEIVSEHFEPMTIFQIANVQSLGEQSIQAFPMAISLLKNNAARDFRLSIETDSTVAQDDADAQGRAVEFTNAITQGLKDALPLINQMPETAEMLTETFSMMARTFRAGRSVDAAIEKFGEMMRQKAQQVLSAPPPQPQGAPPPPPPEQDPRVIAEQIRAQSRAQEMQQNAQIKYEDLALQREKMATNANLEAAKLNALNEERKAKMMLEGIKEGYAQGSMPLV